jgi:ring-1,2-phenylacetyl-CoA epoxidase subunit PaaA
MRREAWSVINDDRVGTGAPKDDDRRAWFLEQVASGGTVEADDWMPPDYRRELIRLITLHGVSELMGTLPEREWVPRAPTLHRKLALMAKVQDEAGHGQLLLRVAEDLMAPLHKTREDIMDDLFHGRQKFHNVFHLPVPTWADAGLIGWLVDGAAIVTQGMLLQGSYGPYTRALRRIVEEEAFHIQHGESISMALAEGTPHQRALFQDALNRWWPSLMTFFGPPSDDPHSRHQARALAFRIRTKTNEELRQRYLTKYVPRIRALGFAIPDPALRQDPQSGAWTYSPPDWNQWWEVVHNHGPCSQDRLNLRRTSYEEGRWVRDLATRA